MRKLCTIMTALFLLCGVNSFAQTNRLENGTEGTDFWFSFPVSWAQGGENALKIYVSCPVAVPCTLEIPGLGVLMVKNTKPNDVIEFTLSPSKYKTASVPL